MQAMCRLPFPTVLTALVLALTLAGCASPAGRPQNGPGAGPNPVHAQALSGNPILPGDNADPHVAVFNGRYYIYPTAYAANVGGAVVPFGPRRNSTLSRRLTSPTGATRAWCSTWVQT